MELNSWLYLTFYLYKFHFFILVLCPPDYEPWEGRCLFVTSFNGTAGEASQFCTAKEGGNVVVAEKEVENMFLTYLVRFHTS